MIEVHPIYNQIEKLVNQKINQRKKASLEGKVSCHTLNFSSKRTSTTFYWKCNFPFTRPHVRPLVGLLVRRSRRSVSPS